MEPKSRQPWVDIAKGVGIVLVVFGHVSRGLSNAGFELPQPWFQAIDQLVYSFHVPLFFAISGWLLAHTLAGKGPRIAFANRLDTVAWPLVVWTWLQGSIEVLLNRWTNFDTTWGLLVQFPWLPHAQFWFLHVLFLSATVVAIGWKGLGHKCLPWMLAVAFVGWWFQSKLTSWTLPAQFFGHFLWFVVGVDTGEWGWRPGRRPGVWACIWAVVFMASHGIASQLGIDPTRGGLTGLAAGVSGIVATIFGAAWLGSRHSTGMASRVLALLGKSSLSIFVLHILVGSGVRVVLARLVPSFPVPIHMLVGIAAALALPIVAEAWLVRWRFRWLFCAPVSRWLGVRPSSAGH